MTPHMFSHVGMKTPLNVPSLCSTLAPLPLPLALLSSSPSWGIVWALPKTGDGPTCDGPRLGLAGAS